MIDADSWWRELTACALVGTARRPVPALPAALGVAGRTDARPEEAALDSAALGGMLRRAGAVPDRHRTAPAPAPPDELPEAPARAVQLLDLMLNQPPAGAENTELLLGHWFRAAHEADRRVPHRLLPKVLDAATRFPGLRDDAAPVLDSRGRWLAAHQADWHWAATLRETPTHVDVHAWSLMSPSERVERLAAARTAEPAAARDLIRATWAEDNARDRAAHLGTLVRGLGPEDELLLEMALDDRAASVRDLAVDLLDALPGSARAARMAERLRPLVQSSGLLGRRLEISLPDDVDAAGVRDGLGKAPRGRSRRGWWLERMVAGAPFDFWTQLTGSDPGTLVRRISDEDALLGLRRATIARRDPVWAVALLERQPDVDLLGILPREERERQAVNLVRQSRTATDLLGLLAAFPGDWSDELSAAVVSRALAEKEPHALLTQMLRAAGTRLHPDALSKIQRWRERNELPRNLESLISGLLQVQSVSRSVTEAFT